MKPQRWWDTPERSVEAERQEFAAAGLDWTLDEDLFENGEIVVFRGELRLGERRTPATVIYPPGYDAGEHPVVVAPALDIGRHRAPNGALCLDHPVLGQLAPMSGIEAVQRAERLWHLWENDRLQLHREEADAPDPWGNYVDHTAETAIVLDLPRAPGDRGFLEVALESIRPIRGSLIRFRQTHPDLKEFELGSAALPGGEFKVQGVWERLAEPPPDPRTAAITHWVMADRQPLAERARRYAAAHPSSEMPALVGFVYPDEGPRRGETHDNWLFMVIRPDNSVEYPQPFALHSDEAWIRQPQLRSLADASVGVVGVGALGSQVAALLARAGVGRFVLVDPDVVTPANRVRHELDLGDVGRAKTAALAERLKRLNPWCEVTEHQHRLGHIGAPVLGAIQALDDQVSIALLDTDLLINATADTAAGHRCSALTRQVAQPALHTWVSAGAWGARILLQREGSRCSGCTECLGRWQRDLEAGEAESVEVPRLSEDTRPQEVLDRGCADPSFTGPGFELTSAAAAAARVAVQVLTDQTYPATDFDLVTLVFRDSDSAQAQSRYTRLPVHPECLTCDD